MFRYRITFWDISPGSYPRTKIITRSTALPVDNNSASSINIPGHKNKFYLLFVITNVFVVFCDKPWNKILSSVKTIRHFYSFYADISVQFLSDLYFLREENNLSCCSFLTGPLLKHHNIYKAYLAFNTALCCFVNIS